MGESVDIAAKLKLLASAENRLVLLGVQVYFLCCVSPVVRCGAAVRPGLVGVGGLTIPSNLLEFLLLQPPVVYRHPR